MLATSFTRLFCTHSVEGRQHIPATGPYILAVNHLGMLDAPLIYTEAGGEHLAAWVAEKWERHLILGPFMRAANGIFIQRGEVDREALEAAVAWLKAGKVFGMAPEGTRSRTHQLNRGKAGIVYLAHQADVPILPAACINTEDALPALLRLRRKHAVLRFGEPFRLPPLDPARRAGSTRDQADEVMCRIAALLPERYHGAYATHPRLAELRPAGGAA
ncbi:MAG: 1-acyl-sn-glycerol-3-phosphate acyltransferase [Anaerolineales bacterium]|nr:1-acyl-sn-glycerol-3-phosphate acyltransferase [Anaerolineales bacterium]